MLNVRAGDYHKKRHLNKFWKLYVNIMRLSRLRLPAAAEKKVRSFQISLNTSNFSTESITSFLAAGYSLNNFSCFLFTHLSAWMATHLTGCHWAIKNPLTISGCGLRGLFWTFQVKQMVPKARIELALPWATTPSR